MTAPTPRVNPFIYGKPVPPLSFIGRREIVRSIFSKLYNGQSLAIIGEPRIGKSSLLAYIADESVRERWLSGTPAWYFFTGVECRTLSPHSTPSDFWRQALAALPHTLSHTAITSQWRVAADNHYGAFVLDRLFHLLAEANWRVVLAVDDCDALLHDHPNFNAEFFGSLRSLSANTRALCLITTSRTAVAAINRRILHLNPHDYPFFNNFVDMRLLPFTPAEYNKLMDTALAGTRVTFTDNDHTFIQDITGRYPFLTQVAAAALFDACCEDLSFEARYLAAGKLFYDRVDMHFDELWQHLSATDQTALVMLMLPETKGRFNGREFVATDLGLLEWYGPALLHLHELGIVERIDRRLGLAELTFWQGARWRIAARSFVWWIAERLLAEAYLGVSFKQWLHDKEQQGLLTAAQIATLHDVLTSIPRDGHSSGPMIKSLVAEMSK